MFAFKGPKRGSFILNILSLTNQKSYNAYWDRYNRLFSQCLMVVKARLRPFLVNRLECIAYAENILDMAIPWAVTAFSRINQFSSNEKEALKNIYLETSSQDFRNHFKDDQDQMNRLFEAHAKEPTPKEIVAVVLAIQRSLDWIYPWAFIKNWKRLSNNKE
jgi:hypothetical protein